MKRFLILIPALLLCSCAGTPVALSYEGAAAGHTYSAGYSSQSGAALVVKQK